MPLRAFFSILWPVPVEGDLTLWTHPEKKSIHVPIRDLKKLDEDDLAELLEANKTQCLYYGLGARQPGLYLVASVRGGKNDIIALPGIALDVDVECETAAHKSKKLPKTNDDVLAILKGGKTPSMVVSTGHGFHFYWLFREPLLLPTPESRIAAGRMIEYFQQPYIDRAAALGFHVDSTASVDRVWRVPGFVNRKVKDHPVPVELVEHDPVIRYVPEEFRFIIGDVGSTASESRQLRNAVRPPISIPGLKKRLKGLSDPKIQLVVAGESFAPAGSRDKALQAVCSTLVWTANGHGQPEELAELLRPSLKVWAAEPDATLTVDDEIAKAIEKISRAQHDFDVKEGPATVERDEYIKMLGRRLIGDKTEPAVEETEKHLIVQHKRSYFIYDTGEDDQYRGPFIKDEVPTVVRDYFKDHFPTTYVNADGAVKIMSLPLLLDRYCTVVRNLEGSFSLQQSEPKWDQSLFIQAVSPLRKLEPRFDQQINEWLHSFTHDARVTEELLDWVAGASQLGKRCGALVLVGPPDTGKTTLADGLSRLWHVGGPTKWAYSVGAHFNESLIRCPLIELSEGLGNLSYGASSEFRDIVGSSAVMVNPKGVAPFWVSGCVRIVISSNDDTVLTDVVGSKEIGPDATQAIAKRLFIVDVGERPRKLIDQWKMKDPRTVDRWIHDDYLARHSLYLAQNRALSESARFLVKGDVDSVHHRLAARRSDSESLLEWLTGFMMSPEKFEQRMKQSNKSPFSCLGGGRVLLHGVEVQETWGVYTNKDTCDSLSAYKISTLLSNLRVSRRKLNRNGARINVHQINPQVVLTFAENAMLGDADRMTANLNRHLNGVVIEEEPDDS